jgi:hypothetical protein
VPFAEMQRCLTEFYGLDLEQQVTDYLITDPWLATVLGGQDRPVDEELLILEGDGEAEVSLYLAKELVARIEANDPVEALSSENLADFWTAFEGVSHFVYFAYKASQDRSVTRLEMELQAEVDKIITTALLIRRQGGRLPTDLHRWLFELPRLALGLSAVETERYERANHYAARYCQQIWPELARGSESLIRELRYFYRLPRENKIGHIESH